MTNLGDAKAMIRGASGKAFPEGVLYVPIPLTEPIGAARRSRRMSRIASELGVSNTRRPPLQPRSRSIALPKVATTRSVPEVRIRSRARSRSVAFQTPTTTFMSAKRASMRLHTYRA
mgnify:CR=1 FL=1